MFLGCCNNGPGYNREQWLHLTYMRLYFLALLYHLRQGGIDQSACLLESTHFHSKMAGIRFNYVYGKDFSQLADISSNLG